MINVGAIFATVVITAAVSVAGTLAALYFGIKWLIMPDKLADDCMCDMCQAVRG